MRLPLLGFSKQEYALAFIPNFRFHPPSPNHLQSRMTLRHKFPGFRLTCAAGLLKSAPTDLLDEVSPGDRSQPDGSTKITILVFIVAKDHISS